MSSTLGLRAIAGALAVVVVGGLLSPAVTLAAVPIAVGDGYGMAEDGSLVVAAPGVLGNDSDPDSDPITAVQDGAASNGTASLAADGSFTYVPDADFNGTDTFTYHVNDGLAPSGSVTVTLTVTAVNDPPTGTLDTATLTVAEDSGAASDAGRVTGMSAGPADEAGQTLTVTATPANGSLFASGPTINSQGRLAFTPATNASGSTSVAVSISDGTASTSLGGFTIEISAVNDTPTAIGESYSTAEDVPVVVAAPGLLANDSDPDPGATLTPIVVAQPSHGTLSLGATGGFTYTPALHYNGTDSFTYKVNDGTADSNTVTVSLTITAVNDPPTVVADAYTTNEDTQLNRNQASVGVKVNDSDPEGNSFTVALVSQPANGLVSNFGSNGTFRYQPTANFSGTDTFTYQGTDSLNATSAPTTVTVTVTPVNDLPIAVADTGSTAEDVTLVAPALALTANDSDIETADPGLIAAVVAQPAHGSVVVGSDGSYTYTPAANYSGPDSFTYRVTDADGGQSNIATVTLTVTAVNDAPLAIADGGTANEDTALVVTAPGVLGNDSDPDGQALVASLVSGPSHGTLTLNANGAYTYTPAANYSGPDSFTYQASDGSLATSATVTLTVNAVNDAPVAGPVSDSTSEDTALVVTAPGLLATVTDIDSTTFTAAVVSQPSHGSVVVGSDGSYTYTPAANYAGPDSFTWRASDGAAFSSAATVSLTVTPVADPPVAVADGRSTNEDTVLSGATVLGNDTDPDAGSVLQAVLDAGPARGTLLLNPNGTFTYTPQLNDNGTVTFTYHATDGTLASNVVTVTITIAAVNDDPVAGGDTGTTAEDTALVVAAPGLKANDSDVETAASSLIASLVTPPASGTAIVNANGSYTYTPAANANGAVSFTYRVYDGAAYSAPATVLLTVTPVNDAPTASGDAYATSEDTALVVAAAAGVLADDTDIDSATLTAGVVSGPSHGSLSLAATGAFTYTPAANYNGPDSFTYRASDGALQSGTATVSLSIAAVNDAPTFALGANPTVAEDSPTTTISGFLTALSPGPADESGQATRITVVAAFPQLFATQPAISTSGTLTFKPATNTDGSSPVTVTVTDDNGTPLVPGDDASAAQSFTITVTGVNDPVFANSDTWLLDDQPPAWIEAGVPTVLDVLANDFSDIGDVLTITSVTKPGHGTVTVSPDRRSLTYRSTTGYAGTDSFKYTASDGVFTSLQASVILSVADTRPPVLATPTLRFVTGSQLGSSKVTVRLGWGATDVGSGVRSYDVQQSTTGCTGTWTTILGATTATASNRSLTLGKGYAFRFRARDKRNRLSGWSACATALPVRYQESTGLASYSSGWRSATIGTASGDHTRYARARDATTTFTFNGRAVSLVAPRSSARGKAEIRVDGVLVATVSLYRSTTDARRHVWARSWSVAGPHVVTIRVLGTSGHPRFDVDAWTVLR